MGRPSYFSMKSRSSFPCSFQEIACRSHWHHNGGFWNSQPKPCYASCWSVNQDVPLWMPVLSLLRNREVNSAAARSAASRSWPSEKKSPTALEGNLLKCCLSTENHWNKLPINFISVLNFNGKFGPNDLGNAWVFGVEHCNCQYGKTQCKLLGVLSWKKLFFVTNDVYFRDSCCLTHAWPNFAICTRLSNPFAIQIFSWAWPRARSKNAIHACICEPNCPRRASEIYFRNSFTYPPLKFQWPRGSLWHI